MTQNARIERLKQYGLGKGAQVIGESYSCYRLNTATPATGLLNGLPFQSNYQCSLVKATKGDVEGESYMILVMKGTCDNRSLLLGDILVDAVGGMYAFAQQRPVTGSNLFVRVEQSASLYRPTPAGGNPSDVPAQGATYTSQYGGYSESTRQVLTVFNGAYSLTNAVSGVAATIPFSVTPTTRLREMRDPKFATQLNAQQYIGYAPLLPGFEIVETDYFETADGSKYEVAEIYSSGNVGLSGYTMLLTEMTT